MNKIKAFFAPVLASMLAFGAFADINIVPKPSKVKASKGKYEDKITVKVKKVNNAVAYQLGRRAPDGSHCVIWESPSQISRSTMTIDDTVDYEKDDLRQVMYDVDYSYGLAVQGTDGRWYGGLTDYGRLKPMKLEKPKVKSYENSITVTVGKKAGRFIRYYVVYRGTSKVFDFAGPIGYMIESGKNMIYRDYDVEFGVDYYYWVGYNPASLPADQLKLDRNKVSSKVNRKITKAGIQFRVNGEDAGTSFCNGDKVEAWFIVNGNPIDPTSWTVEKDKEACCEIEPATKTLGVKPIKGLFSRIYVNSVKGKAKFTVTLGNKTYKATLKVKSPGYTIQYN